jgi:hypothetical protein
MHIVLGFEKISGWVWSLIYKFIKRGESTLWGGEGGGGQKNIQII